jgi:hypothetical protein
VELEYGNDDPADEDTCRHDVVLGRTRVRGSATCSKENAFLFVLMLADPG